MERPRYNYFDTRVYYYRTVYSRSSGRRIFHCSPCRWGRSLSLLSGRERTHIAQGKLIIVMVSARRNNQFSISTRDHCHFPRDYFPGFPWSAVVTRQVVMGRQLSARKAYAKTRNTSKRASRDLRDARTWYEAPSSCDLHVVVFLFLLLKILGRRISTKSATQNLWHHRHALGGSAARPVGRASETLFKGGFTLFLEALFRPGGTDLAVAGVLLVYVRATQRWRRGKRRKRAKHLVWIADRDSLSFTRRTEHN